LTQQAPPGWSPGEPSAAAAWQPAEPSPLSRHRGWQWTSIGLIVAGLIVALFALGIAGASAQMPELNVSPLYTAIVLAVGGGLLVIGCLMNIGRAIVVRRRLPDGRYRGGSVLIMLLLAAVVATAVELPFTSDVIALTTGQGQMTELGTLVLLTILQVSLVIITVVFVLWPDALAGIDFFSGSTLRAVAVGVLWGIPAWIVATLLAAIVAQLLAVFNIQPEPQIAEQFIDLANPWIAVLATVVVAPIAEETFFRGVAFNAWMREYGVRRAVVLSALLFALIHGSLGALVPIFALGVALAVLYRRTGNLASNIALHATFNGISVLLALLVRFGVLVLPQ
jgi:membrane protease YdiL (CAAX protease family)